MAKLPERLVAGIAQDGRGRRGAKLPYTRFTPCGSVCQVPDIARWQAFGETAGPFFYITGIGIRTVHSVNAGRSPVRSTSTARSNHRLPDSQLVSDANRHA